MMTASNIMYDIDEKNKIVKATVYGCKNDAIDTVLKAFRCQNLFLSNNTYIDQCQLNLTTCHKFLLKDTYTGIAMYNKDDPNPFSIERGKQIARRRLYAAYNSDYQNILNNIVEAIKSAIDTDIEKARAITEERLINFKYYEYYDILKLNLEESFKQ